MYKRRYSEIDTYYCPLCGTKHTTDKAVSNTICKCGKKLKVRIADKGIKIKIYNVTWDDFKM